MLKGRFRAYILLFVVAVLFAGSSILYLSSVAKKSDTPVARLYPASNTGVGGVTIDNVILTKNLLENHIFSRDTQPPLHPDTWRTPGYPAFTSILYYLFGTFYAVIIAHIFLIFFTSILIFKMAERVMTRKLALAVSIVYLILPDTLLSASALFTESLFVFIFTSTVYVLLFADMKNMYLRWALAGFLLALSAYVRPASQYILVFLIPAYFLFQIKKSEINRKHIVAVLLIIIAFYATLSPWYIRNKNETGIWGFTSSGAFILLRHNAAQFYASMTGKDILVARQDLLDKAGIPLSSVPREAKYSAAMQKVALETIFAHPFKYAVFHATSLIPFFTSSGANEYVGFIQNMLPDFVQPPEPSLIQALNPFSLPLLVTVIKNHGWNLLENALWGLVTLLMVIGLWRSQDVRLARMFFAIIIYFALITGPIAHARYRIPVEPLLLISAFSAGAFLWDKYKSKHINAN